MKQLWYMALVSSLFFSCTSYKQTGRYVNGGDKPPFVNFNEIKNGDYKNLNEGDTVLYFKGSHQNTEDGVIRSNVTKVHYFVVADASNKKSKSQRKEEDDKSKSERKNSEKSKSQRKEEDDKSKSERKNSEKSKSQRKEEDDKSKSERKNSEKSKSQRKAEEDKSKSERKNSEKSKSQRKAEEDKEKNERKAQNEKTKSQQKAENEKSKSERKNSEKTKSQQKAENEKSKSERKNSEKSKSQQKAENEKSKSERKNSEKSKSETKQERSDHNQSKSERKNDDQLKSNLITKSTYHNWMGYGNQKNGEEKPHSSSGKKVNMYFFKKVGKASGGAGEDFVNQINLSEDKDAKAYRIRFFVDNRGSLDFKGDLTILDHLPKGVIFKRVTRFEYHKLNTNIMLPLVGIFPTLFGMEAVIEKYPLEKVKVTSKGAMLQFDMKDVILHEASVRAAMFVEIEVGITPEPIQAK